VIRLNFLNPAPPSESSSHGNPIRRTLHRLIASFLFPPPWSPASSARSPLLSSGCIAVSGRLLCRIFFHVVSELVWTIGAPASAPFATPPFPLSSTLLSIWFPSPSLACVLRVSLAPNSYSPGSTPPGKQLLSSMAYFIFYVRTLLPRFKVLHSEVSSCLSFIPLAPPLSFWCLLSFVCIIPSSSCARRCLRPMLYFGLFHLSSFSSYVDCVIIHPFLPYSRPPKIASSRALPPSRLFWLLFLPFSLLLDEVRDKVVTCASLRSPFLL